MNYLDAVVRLFQRKMGGSVELSMSEWEALRITQQELRFQEETRANKRFWLGITSGVTGIAPVQAIPTTAAQWVLWNKDQFKSVILDQVDVYLVSGTAGAGIVLLGALFQTPSQDAVAPTANMVIFSGNGNGGAGSTANSCVVVKASVTLSIPAAPVWFPITQAPTAATAIASTATAGQYNGLEGKIIIPPKSGLALAVASPAGTTPLYAPYASWIEKVVTNE